MMKEEQIILKIEILVSRLFSMFTSTVEAGLDKANTALSK